MSIADFLLSPLQQRILAPLLLNPGRKYKLTELLKLSGPGRGAGQLQINKMLLAGVLTQEHLGNQRHIQINTHFPLYAELRSICLKTFGLRDKLGEVLHPVASLIDEAFVFGSVARGEDNTHSDIDLMVVGSVDLIALMDLIAPAERELGRPVDVNLHTHSEWEQLRKTDRVILEIVSRPTLKIIPYAKTS